LIIIAACEAEAEAAAEESQLQSELKRESGFKEHEGVVHRPW